MPKSHTLTDFKRDRYPASFSENTEHFRHALVHLAFLAAFIARAAFAVAIAVFITDGTGVTIPAADDFIIIFFVNFTVFQA